MVNGLNKPPTENRIYDAQTVMFHAIRLDDLFK